MDGRSGPVYKTCLTISKSQTRPLHDTQTNTPTTVLLVDDRHDSRIMTKWFLGNFGYAVDSAWNAEEALRLFDPEIHGVVITDNSMPGMTGSELARAIKARSRTTRVLMYAGSAPDANTPVDVVVLRPTHLMMLKDAVEKLLTRS
jgi:CheY-like chemotaxis protein